MPDLRRRLLNAAGLALLAWPLAALAKSSDVSETPLPGLRRWGRGEFRRFGFLVYEASLWAGDDPTRPPLALRLDYKRRIAGSAIAEASVKEMRRFGGEETVLDGDHILGVYTPDGARFAHNGRDLGGVDDARFARDFFGIWLDPRTSAPELRAALLTPLGA